MASADPLARQPELTIRSILTGVIIGAALTPCNVYAGLKIGWAFNMAIAAGLVASESLIGVATVAIQLLG